MEKPDPNLSPYSHTRRFLLTPLSILLFMFCFELAIQFLHSDETVWESHFTTVISSTLLGSAAAFVMLRKYRLLDVRVVEETARRKQVEFEKESYRLNLEAIFQSMKDAIVSVDGSLKLLELNESAERLCGFPRTGIGEDIKKSAKCSLQCIKAIEDTVATGKGTECQRTECLRNGQRRIVTIVVSPLLTPGGVSRGAVMVVKDETRLVSLEERTKDYELFHKIVGRTKVMQGIYSRIEALKNVNSTILITGESGTGKELIVDAIHYTGNRSGKPLVKVNCSALPESLLESELFGHTRGAFTGAIEKKTGRFEMANGGTIFLDEIGDLSPKVQVQLLRVIQTKEFELVGDSKPVKVDVQIIAATNRNLQKLVRAGIFREDLFFRLKVVEITLPPLRERRDDIPLLVRHFLRIFGARFEKKITSVSSDVIRLLLEHPLPGNVRQLEHALEHAFIFCRKNIITLDDLPADFAPGWRSEFIPPGRNGPSDRGRILDALEKANGNKTRAARLLGINRRTLYRKIEQFGLAQRKMKM